MVSLITPFEATICNLPTLKTIQDRQYNYTPMDLFCLKTQLLPILQDLYGPVDLIYYSEPYEDHMRVLIRTYPDKIKSDDIKLLQDMIRYYVDNFRGKAILYDLTKSIPGNVFVPNWFVQAFIRRIKIKGCFIQRDSLFIDLTQFISPSNDYRPEVDIGETMSIFGYDYMNGYINTFDDIITTLSMLWKSGYIIMSQDKANRLKLESAIPLNNDSIEIDLSDVYLLNPSPEINQNLSLDSRIMSPDNKTMVS